MEPSHFPSGRPDILAFLPDKSYILDLVISHPSAPSHLLLPTARLSSAKQAEARKITRYSSLPTSTDLSLVPFSIETFGALGPKASSFLSILDSLARDSISSSLPCIASSLAILLQKCNAYILSRGIVMASASVHR